MGTLTLVRHAQASFFADHYDQLSALGETQARMIGADWVRHQRIVDEVYVGPRQRQQQTAALIAECYAKEGRPFPEPVILPELDEYDLGGILKRLAPEFARTDAIFGGLFEQQRHGTTDHERARSFQKMFEPLMVHWQTKEPLEGVEVWSVFQERVQRGLQQMIDRPGKGRRVLAISSGGFIGAAVQIVLGAPARSALELNWRIRNGAVTEFMFSGDRITLDTFNTVEHFAAPELRTYR